MGTEHTIKINGHVLTGWRKAVAIPLVWLFCAYLDLCAFLIPIFVAAAMMFPVWGSLLLLTWLAR